MEGGRLSRPRHCRKGAQPVPNAVHRSGCRDKHNWPRPLTPQPCMLPLDRFDLPRHVGVNNLPEVVTRQRRTPNHQVWNYDGRYKLIASTAEFSSIRKGCITFILVDFMTKFERIFCSFMNSSGISECIR